MQKIINISSNLLFDAIKDDSHLEALAFNLLIKSRYTRSHFNSDHVTDVMSIFGVGHTRAKRVLSNGVHFDLIEERQNRIHAKQIRIYGSKRKNLVVKLDRLYLSGCTLDDAIRYLRETVLKLHVKRQNEITRIAKNSKNPSNTMDYKRAKAFLKSKDVKGIFDELSYKRIAEILNVSARYAIDIVKDLINRGVLSVTRSRRELIYDYNDARAFFKAIAGEKGVFYYNGNVFRQLPNKYNLKEELRTAFLC